MSISNQKYYLDLSSGTRAPVTVHVSQGDVGRAISFSILSNGEPFSLTTESVTVHGTRRDGANFGPYNCSYSDDVVSFTTTSSMTAVAGSAIAEISIANLSNEKIGTANFAILVEQSTFPNGVSYDTDPSVYEDILKYVQQTDATITNRVDAFESSTNTKITNHEATVANQISTFESTVNNTVNQIIASSGNDNTEIVNARMIFDGTSKSTLKLRLDQFLEYDNAGTTDGIGTISTLSEEITAAVIEWLNTHPANLVYAKDGTISFYIIENTEDIDG